MRDLSVPVLITNDNQRRKWRIGVRPEASTNMKQVVDLLTEWGLLGDPQQRITGIPRTTIETEEQLYTPSSNIIEGANLPEFSSRTCWEVWVEDKRLIISLIAQCDGPEQPS